MRYTGTLICHKSERNKINKTFRFTEVDEQFRHEKFLPVIINKELWEQVQQLLELRKQDNVRAGEGNTIHRYSGLIVCGDCGRAFTVKTIRNKNSKRIEYWCSTYIRYGKEHCGSHALREEYLDEIIIEELRNTKQQYQQCQSTNDGGFGCCVTACIPNLHRLCPNIVAPQPNSCRPQYNPVGRCQSHRADLRQELAIVEGGKYRQHHFSCRQSIGPYEEGPQQRYQQEGNHPVKMLPSRLHFRAEGYENTVDHAPQQILDAVPNAGYQKCGDQVENFAEFTLAVAA